MREQSLFKVILTALIVLTPSASFSQKLEVVDFHEDVGRLDAVREQVKDLNGSLCGLIRLGLVHSSVEFEGNIMKTEYRNCEWYIWMADGAKFIVIKATGYTPLHYDFNDTIKSMKTYIMQVEQSNVTARWIFNTYYAFSFNPQHSIGLLTGQLFGNKWGWYSSLQTNFRFKLNGDYEVEGNEPISSLPFTTGKKHSTRMQITLGIMYQMADQWQLTFGAGFGARALFWETTSEKTIKINSGTYSGLVTEAGTVCLINDWMNIMFGIGNINFRYWEAKIGVGVNF